MSQDRIFDITGHVVRANEDDEDELRIGDQALADWATQFKDSLVSVRYWVCDQEITKDKAAEVTAEIAMGLTSADYRVHHSDITGYLYTDETFTVGGHNLIEELEGFEGRYVILEVVLHAHPSDGEDLSPELKKLLAEEQRRSVSIRDMDSRKALLTLLSSDNPFKRN